MRGIIIAAGLGMRLRPMTEQLPKCMLPIVGRPLLHHTMRYMRSAGCQEFVVIVGHSADKVDADGATLVTNTDYENNNILHSLMYASEFMNGPVMCSYSDILVEPRIHSALAKGTGDICLAVDNDWIPYYDNRTDHPLSEAENVFFDNDGRIVKLGKHLHPGDAGEYSCGEFLGLWRLSARGCEIWRETFEALDAKLERKDPFQQAAEWRKSYITDFSQELIDRGNRIDTTIIQRGWAEIDTQQDYERLAEIARRQGLQTLYEGAE
ncbi:MAG: phosphocholine cytidylyltransferase family protein [Alphaproteobacteria bacterium]|nr:phosphocholine cytidylyltransferase family protein [Alphaproteobacteria bacterium]